MIKFKGKTWIWNAAILVVLIIGLFNLYRWGMHLQVERKYAELRRDGYPVTLQELNEWYPQIPDEENGALIYTNAFSKLLPSNSTNYFRHRWWLNLRLRKQNMPEEVRLNMEEYLAKHKEALELLRTNLPAMQFRYPVDLREGWGYSSVHLQDLQRAQSLLFHAAIYHANGGDKQKAIQSILTLASLLASLEREPLSESKLVQSAGAMYLKEALEFSLNRLEFDAEELDLMEETLESAFASLTLKPAFVGEMVLILDALSKPRDFLVPGLYPFSEHSNPDEWRYKLRRQGFKLLHHVYYSLDIQSLEKLTFMDRYKNLIANSDLDFYEAKLAFQKDEAILNHLPAYYSASRQTTQWIKHFLARLHRSRAELRIALAAIEIEKFRFQHQSLPARLNELVPEVPVDPYDGMPLRFKSLTNGYVVYSIGEDERDDGGNEQKKIGARDTAGYDMTFIMEQ